MYPIECWDLLYILSQKNDSVLGDKFSRWRTDPKKALDLIIDREQLNGIGLEQWQWKTLRGSGICKWISERFMLKMPAPSATGALLRGLRVIPLPIGVSGKRFNMTIVPA